MMSQDAFSGDDDLYINLLQNIRMMMECPPSLGEKVSLGKQEMGGNGEIR